MKFRVSNQIWTFASFKKKGSNALEAFDHWPQFNDSIEDHSFSPRIPAKPGFQ